jgi:hypothetical protein
VRPRSAGLLLGCCLILAPAARAVAAGDGVRLGSALLFPTLVVSETYDNNIFLAEKGAGVESDWITAISPALRLVMPLRRYYLEAEGGLDFLMYNEFDEESAANWFVGASAGAEFPGGLSFKIGDRYASRYLVTSQEYGPGEDSSWNTLEATVAYVIRDAVRLELSGQSKDFTYETSLDRERVERLLRANAYWKFSSRLSALLEAAFNDYAYDSNTAQDGSATQLGLGLTWDVSTQSAGFAKAGYQWKRYDEENPALGTENAEYFTLAAGVRHFFTRRTMVQADLARGSWESDFQENPYYLRTSLNLIFSQRFTTKLYGRANLGIYEDAYPNETTFDNPFDLFDRPESGKRTDSTFVGVLAVGFDATRWLALELSLGREERDSTFATFSYTSNRVSLIAKAAF